MKTSSLLFLCLFAPGLKAASALKPVSGTAQSLETSATLQALSTPAQAQALSPKAQAQDLSPKGQAEALPFKSGQSPIDIFDKMLKAQKAQASLEADISKQEKGGEGGPSKVSGTLKVKNGGYALLLITSPSEQKLVSDGTSLWMELPDVKQSFQYDAKKMRESGNFFLDLGSSIRFYARNSTKRVIRPADESFSESEMVALELKPLRPNEAGFERMEVWVKKGDWTIRQVALKLGSIESKVRFENLKVTSAKDVKEGKAKALPNSLFRYKPPKGYQVFNMMSMQ